MWELISAFGMIATVYIGFQAIQWLSQLFIDPEQTLERLGGLVAAFRRGLAGSRARQRSAAPARHYHQGPIRASQSKYRQ
jgi:hypothetical protein